jgi:hypothetical protein
MWCGGSELLKECPEKGNTALILTCNCKLVDGEEPHPSKYRGYRHAKEEMLKRITESMQDYNRKGVLFQLHHPRAILHGGATQHTQQQQQPQPSSLAQA